MRYGARHRGWGAAALTGWLGLLGAAQVARADVPPPNLSQCEGKRVGTSCVTDNGKDGACQSSTCSRHRLAEPPPPSLDGGLTDTSPHWVFSSYDCVVCAPKGSPAPSAAVDAAAAPAPIAPAAVDAAAVPAPIASATASATPPAPASNGGCSVGSDAGAAGSSSLFLLAAVFFLSARTRRASRGLRSS